MNECIRHIHRLNGPKFAIIFKQNGKLMIEKRELFAMKLNFLPIIFRCPITFFCVASNVDNITDDLHARLCVANSKISMLLSDFPVDIFKKKNRIVSM